MDDEQMLSELLATDLTRHFREIVLRYQDQLYSFAYRLTGSGQDAEDIVQEALLGAYVTLGQYPATRIHTLRLRPWLYKVTLNVFRNSKRGMRLLLMSLDFSADGEVHEWLAAENERPEILYEEWESRQELEAQILALPERYRLAVTCYYYEDFSYQEIADLLDQPLGTVKSRLHRGVQILRKTLSQQNEAGRSSYGAR